MATEMKNFIPRNGRILVLQPEVEKMTESKNLHLPESAQFRPNKGVIIAIDPAIETYKIGDKILFHKAGGFLVTINGTEYRMINILEVFMSYEGDD